MLTFEDKALSCSDCNANFAFSADEQKFFALKGLLNEPKRCPDCRVIARLKREGKQADIASQVSCADCGELSVVPFKPKGSKPVYCSKCLRARNSNNARSIERREVPVGRAVKC